MTDPTIVDSPLSRTVIVQDEPLQIKIYRLETDTRWTMEIVDEQSTSTVWDATFDSDEAAWAEAIRTIEEEGLEPFKIRTIH